MYMKPEVAWAILISILALAAPLNGFAQAADSNRGPDTPTTTVPLNGVEAEKRLEELFAERPDNNGDIDVPFTGGPRDIKNRAEKVFAFAIPQLQPIGEPQAAVQDVESIKTIKAQADAGDAYSQLMLGILCLIGRGTPQDPAYGVAMLEKAAQGGEARAVYGLAQMYEIGLVVPVDKQKAAQYYLRLTSDKRWKEIGNRLGAMYEDGMGFPQNFEKAMYWYKAAAEPVGKYMPGIAVSKYNVGRLYAQGKGAQTDFWEAAEWFVDAADYQSYGKNAYPPAQCALAIMYLAGLGVQKDERQADFWLANPSTLRSKTCSKIAKARGVTPSALGIPPVFRIDTAAQEPNVRPHFHGPYPFSADELMEKILEVAKLPEGYVTKEQVENIFGVKLPPAARRPFNPQKKGDPTGDPMPYETEAGKDWYFNVSSFNPSETESVFYFTWGDLRHEKVGALHEPPAGMCINVNKAAPEIEKLGWVLDEEYRDKRYFHGNSYRKGKLGHLRIDAGNFNSDKNCLTEVYISRLNMPPH